MGPQTLYRGLADGVLVAHFAVVLFVIFGLAVTLLGGALRWRWVGHRVFRVAHLVAIGVVVAQAWLGVACPLTTLENWLRDRGGQPGYEASFIEHWVGGVLFYQAPGWVFTAAYTAFGALVLASFWVVPVRWRGLGTR